ncbi:MAG TPA: type III-B CRISPR module RAMP protein Cmr1 [Leptospiraceae bacterium]|nr:type III-B CRISPR module RAMP protein Cmr1 [Leptospiraceae bacterium]
MMETIKFECEVITPMFLGGADGKSAELRAPSIKGALRFWWRAMNGHLPLKELHEREAKIFGSSDGGRSNVILRVASGSVQTRSDLPTGKTVTQPSFYTRSLNIGSIKYAGFGTYDFHSPNLNRHFIIPASKYSIILRVIEKSFLKEVLDSFFLLSLFGGIGSKSRNGFGSFHISNVNLPQGYSKPTLTSIYSNISTTNTKAYMALSKQIQLFETKIYTKWDEALSEIADCYRLARLESDGKKYSFDNRKYLCEPLNQNRSEKLLDRHTKPFFMKVAKENNGYKGILLYIPSPLLDNPSKDLLQSNMSIADLNSGYLKACNRFITKLESLNRIKKVLLP